MDHNPLSDIADRIRQNQLDTIQADVEAIKQNVRCGMTNPKLIRLDAITKCDGGTTQMLVNPQHIMFIEGSGDSSYVHLSDGSILFVKDPQDAIEDQINGVKYIK